MEPSSIRPFYKTFLSNPSGKKITFLGNAAKKSFAAETFPLVVSWMGTNLIPQFFVGVALSEFPVVGGLLHFPPRAVAGKQVR
jgi:hypothetical protein